jgi:hypothetical protein
MAVTTYVYNKGLYNILAGNIHFMADTIKVCLMPSTYTPNIDSHEYYSDISASECPATGNYTAGGQALANKVLNEDEANDLVYFDANDPVWAALTQADIRFAVAYKDTGTAATSVLLMCWDFGANQAPAAVLFSLPIPVAGLFDIKKDT